jgi:hypothetical protein
LANAFNKNFGHNKLLNVHYFNYRHEKITDMNYISKVVQRRTFIDNYRNYYHDNILAIDDWGERWSMPKNNNVDSY